MPRPARRATPAREPMTAPAIAPPEMPLLDVDVGVADAEVVVVALDMDALLVAVAIVEFDNVELEVVMAY
jgi:hypothetical protein